MTKLEYKIRKRARNNILEKMLFPTTEDIADTFLDDYSYMLAEYQSTSPTIEDEIIDRINSAMPYIEDCLIL